MSCNAVADEAGSATLTALPGLLEKRCLSRAQVLEVRRLKLRMRGRRPKLRYRCQPYEDCVDGLERSFVATFQSLLDVKLLVEISRRCLKARLQRAHQRANIPDYLSNSISHTGRTSDRDGKLASLTHFNDVHITSAACSRCPAIRSPVKLARSNNVPI
jgi:hypothetical protein